jgi:ATP-dependent DNA helicase RecQ
VEQVSGKTDGLYERLRKFRTAIAMEAGIPAFMVFSNATLMDMARRKPLDMDRMLRVSGVGQVKAERYGQEFLEEIRRWMEEQG